MVDSESSETKYEMSSSENAIPALEAIQKAQRDSQPIDTALNSWQKQTGIGLDREVSEYGYPIVDLLDQAPLVALDVLREIGASANVVYHGVHNNEFRRGAGMPEVAAWDALDPSLSHQPDKEPSVYASRLLEGGLAHAVLEHKFSDQDPESGETYAISMNRSPGGKILEVSAQIAGGLERGEDRFTDGLLYILPADAFSDTPNSDQEVYARDKVVPLAVVRVGRNLGPTIVNPSTYAVREGNEYRD